jgi:hypothetical protein
VKEEWIPEFDGKGRRKEICGRRSEDYIKINLQEVGWSGMSCEHGNEPSCSIKCGGTIE